jgi:ligand-binding sensor domain-containing protein
MSALNGMGEVWAGNSSGISKYDLSDISNPTKDGQVGTFGVVNFASADCNRIAVQDNGDLIFWNEYYEAGYALGFPNKPNLKLSSYNRTTGFTNLTPTTTIAQPMWVVEDSKDPETYYVGTYNAVGLIQYKNQQEVRRFTTANSPITNYYGYRIAYIGFDYYDNFWVVQENGPDVDNIRVISHTKLQEDTPDNEDWQIVNAGTNASRWSVVCMLKQNPLVAVARGKWSGNMTLFKVSNTTNITGQDITTYIDQDNKTLSFNHLCSMAEDQRGHLWVGTNNGVFEITDPTTVTSDVVTVNHLKVPRNDGTGLADYLLDALTVSGIAVDNSNRKWLSTTTDGVYLVSEDGDEILEHYTTSNSILPSDCVYSVACDPNSSSVFFATASGVVEYNSTSAPASDNLDNVYAFPNPVRPDYSGWITVTGLMDNTLVKITDAAGNLVYQGRSEGGIITWDGCNFNGERVKTGVYFVFASNGTSSDSSSESCVTKIMVIN